LGDFCMGVHATVRGCGRTSIAFGTCWARSGPFFSVLVALARFFPVGAPNFSGISTWPRWREKFLMALPFFAFALLFGIVALLFGDFAHTRAGDPLPLPWHHLNVWPSLTRAHARSNSWLRPECSTRTRKPSMDGSQWSTGWRYC
jgi:uncharacterized membrane protein YhdT